MTPLLPAHARQFFGAQTESIWGGVPWDAAHEVKLSLQGLWHGAVAVFPKAVQLVTDDDIDTDGARGSKAIDPWWQPSTNLKWPDGSPIDSWAFSGMVLPPTLTQFHVAIGDLCLVCLNGVILPAQMHDTGPVRKCGETTLFLGRRLGAVPASQSDHQAAFEGNDVTTMCTLIFAGSGETIRRQKGWRFMHALPEDEISVEAMRCWQQFTGRAAV